MLSNRSSGLTAESLLTHYLACPRHLSLTCTGEWCSSVCHAYLTSAFARGYYSLARSGLLPTSVLALTWKNCILTEEFLKRLYQITTQWQISHTVSPWSSLTWSTSCPNGTAALPNKSIPILAHTIGCYRPAALSPHPDPASSHGSASTKT